MKLASTTDDKAVVSAVANGEEAREPQTQFELEQQLDGSSAVAFEHPASERSLLLERLRLEELEADQLIGPEDEVETVDALGEVRDAPVAPAEKEPEAIQPAQESAQPVAQPSAAGQFHQRIGQLSIVNPQGVQALASTKLEIPQPVLNLLGSDPAGADLAIHLAEHPEVAAELNKMPIERAVRETQEALIILKYEAQKAAGQQATAPRARAVSAAPAPIKPLGGGNTKSSLPLDQMSYQEFRKARDREAKARYSR
jgi:hypothetical protein